jgi:hypothetical protein
VTKQKELLLDGVSNQTVDPQSYVKARSTPVALETFAPEGAKIVTPNVRASAVIRTLLGDDLRPADADEITEEEVNVDCIDVHFRPAYWFRYVWTAKNKMADVAVDAG